MKDKRKNKKTKNNLFTKNPLYMDFASSATPNPSSIHSLGVIAKSKLEKARTMVSSLLHVNKDEIIFTSGGTESNNLAIQGLVNYFNYSLGKNLPHIITTNIEHPSVLETFKNLEKRKLAEISIVDVENNGIINPKKIKKEIKDNTILISVMYANNEIGTIQPINDIAKEIRYYKKIKKLSKNNFPFFHTDAVQAVNYLDLNIEKLGVDMLTLSGTKIINSGRVGILCKKRYVNLLPIIFGGDQELGLRPGTENLDGILKFSEAFLEAEKNKNKENKNLTKLQKYFIRKIISLKKEIIFNGDLEKRLPNNINITFPKIPSDLIVLEFSSRGVMVSSKSACKSSSKEGSYVISAINKDIKKDIGGVRFSFNSKTKKSDIDYIIKELKLILLKLEKWYN